MARKYFSYLPNLEYIDRTQEGNYISDYTEVKNIFKRAKIRKDIFQDLQYFTKYQIIGDERPDNIAYKVYRDENLDWLVLLSNNIVNYENEWPLSQRSFDNYLIQKYGDYSSIYSAHHYETFQVRDSLGDEMIGEGLEVASDFSITFYDRGLKQEVTKSEIYEVTNYDYENRKQEEKRNIFLLKSEYLNLVITDIESLMPYRQGSTQYVNPSTVKGDNIRLFF